MDKTIEKIKTLKSIVPDADFLSLSRALVLASSSSPSIPKIKRSFVYEFGISLGVMAAAVTMVVFLANIGSTEAIANNMISLENEAISVSDNIDITLREVDSFNQSAKKTALALSEAAAGSDARHMNELILSSEMKKLDFQVMPDENVEKLFDQAIF